MRALLVAVTATISALSAALPAPPAQALVPNAYERLVVDVTNHERTDHHLRRLRTDACLARFANRHATRMARQHRVFHQDLRPVRRRCDLSRVGENVARGFSDGRSVVMEGWMRSPGHRAAILARPFRIVAVGATRSDAGGWYTAQVLARR